MSLVAEINRAARETHRSPSPAQAESGNYRKGRVVLHGLPVRIETPRGATRRGIGADGKPWSVRMPAHYGYVEKTNGADGDEVDCYIGPNPESKRAFIVDQQHADTKKFDEHKLMLAFSGPGAARRCYMAGFSDGKGRHRIKHMTEVSIDDLKQLLQRPGFFHKAIKRQSGGAVTGADPDRMAATAGVRRMIDESGYLPEEPTEPGVRIEDRRSPLYSRAPYQQEARRRGLTDLIGRVGYQEGGDVEDVPPQRPYIEITPHDRPTPDEPTDVLGSGRDEPPLLVPTKPRPMPHDPVAAWEAIGRPDPLGIEKTLHSATPMEAGQNTLEGVMQTLGPPAGVATGKAALAAASLLPRAARLAPDVVGPSVQTFEKVAGHEGLFNPLPIPEDAAAKLKRHLARSPDVGGPNLESAVKLGDGVYVGPVTLPQWIDRVEAHLSPDEIMKARNWYKEALPTYIKYFGPEKGPAMLGAWLTANVNATPSFAQLSATRTLEQFVNKTGAFAPENKQGGLAHDKLMQYWDAILNNDPSRLGEAGSGQKIYDFIDSALGKNTRTFYGDHPAAGAPAVADVHSYRDMGIIDGPLLSWVENKYGKQAASKVAADVKTMGGQQEARYEWAANKMRSFTDELNRRGYMGGDWTPAELQAVGWTAMSKMTGRGAETAPQAIEANIRNLSYELDFGAGAPYNQKFAEWHNLGGDQKTQVSNEVLPRILDFAKATTGAHGFADVSGLGGWGQFTNPSYKSRLIASPEVAGDVADMIGLLAQQTKVFGYRAVPSGNRIGVALYGPALQDETNVSKLWAAVVEKHPDLAAGFSPSVNADGVHGMEIILDKAGAKTLARVQNELIPTIDQLAHEMGLGEIRAKDFRVAEESRSHDWTADPEGSSYLRRLSARYGPDIQRRLELFRREELEPALRNAIRKAGLTPAGKARGGRIGYAEGGSPGGDPGDWVTPPAAKSDPSDWTDVGGGGAQQQYKPVKDERWWGTGFKDEKTGDPLVREQATGKQLGSVSRVYDSGPVFNDPSGNEVHVDPRKHVMRYEGGQRNVYERGPDTYRPWTWSDMGLLQSLWGGLTAGPDIVAGNVAPEDVYKRAGETAMLAMPGGAPVAGRVARVPGPSGERFVAREPGVSPTGGLNPADLARAEEAAGATARRSGAVRGAEDLENEFGFKYSEGQRTGDVNLQEYEDQAANGAFGPVAQKYAIDRIRAREASLRAAGQDVGQRLGEAETHGFFETPQEAGQQIVGDVSERARASRLAAARAEEEATQAANAQRQIIEDQRAALTDIVGQGRQPGTLRDVGEAVGEEVRGASRAARTARSQLYQDVAARPGEFEPGAFPALGRRIANELENRQDPIFVDENTPLSRSSLETMNNSEHLGIQQRATTPQERAAAREAGREIPDTVNEYVPTDLRRVDQARKLLVRNYSRAQQAARASGYYADVNAMREIMRSFDQHVEDALANGLFSGDPAALDAMRGARAAHADYARTYWSRDDVGTALRKIIDRNATPEEIGTMILGSANLRSGLPVRLADRLETIFGRDSETWGDIRNAIWQRSSQVRNARGEIDPVRTAQSVLDLANSSLGRAVYEPEVLAAMRRHAAGVRDLADVIETLPETLQARAARIAHEDMFGGEGIGGAQQAIFRRIVSGEATPQEAASAIRSAIGSKNPGNVIRLINAIERITGPDSTTMAAIRQDVWNAMTKAAEQSRQPGARKVSEAIAKFMDGDIARRIYTETERNIGLRYAEAVRRTEVPDFASNPSRSASKVLGGLRRLVGDMASHLATSAGAAVGAFAGPLGSAVGAAIGRVIEGTRASIGDAAQGRKFLRSQEGLPLEEPTITSPRRRLSPAEQIMRQIGAGQGYLISGAASRKLIGYSPTPQMPSVVPAEEKKKKVPGKPAEQKHGGEVNEPHRARGGRIGLSHEAVGYTKTSPHKDKRCGLCSMFRTAPRVHCTDVRDPIRALGYCEIFDRKKR